MAYLALYRRFRPKGFSNGYVGQEHVVKTLKNQIKTDSVGHAYLFCGARGTGKTSTAKIFAKAINCLNPIDGSPCEECEVCKKLSSPTNLDITEMDAASNNKVEHVRELREKIQYPPVAGRFKVYIIDEVHMLTPEAFNALLKTLEEPPKHAVFILATTEVHKLPSTILSRCMRFDFKLIPVKQIEGLIKDIYDEIGKKYQDQAITAIAKAGEGSIRDALSIADICLSYSDGVLTYEDVINVIGASDSEKTSKLVTSVLGGQTGEALSLTDKIINMGKNVSVLTRDVISYIRDMMVVKTAKNAKEVLSLPEDKLLDLKSKVSNFTEEAILRVLEIFTGAEAELKYSVNPRIILETCIIKASRPSQDYDLNALMARIAKLENLVEELSKNRSTVVVKQAEEVAVPVLNRTEEVKSNFNSLGEEAECSSNFNFEDNSSFKQEEPKEKSFTKTLKEERSKEQSFGEEDFYAIPIPEAPPEEENSFPQASAPLQTVAPNKVWGTFLRNLRGSGNAVLWAACLDLTADVNGKEVTINAQEESEFMLLSKEDNLKTVNSILWDLGGYKASVRKVGGREEAEEKFKKDINEIKKMFGENIVEIK